MARDHNEPLYRSERLFIGGQWREPVDGNLVLSTDPSTGSPWASVAFGGVGDVDLAVAAASEALPGWRARSVSDRVELLRSFAARYEWRSKELARLESRDNGRPIRETTADISAHPRWYNYCASLGETLDGRFIPVNRSTHVYTTREPVGVVGAIVPWNAPLLLAAWKLGPALAAGCTVVLKPAELTSVTAMEIGRIAEEVGIPPGVINIVPGTGDTVGARLVEHPDVAKISFTGDYRTAVTIMRQSADSLKRVSFECGGKSPHIIFDDADIGPAINAATHGSFMACGQSCALGSRVLVHKAVYQRVAKEIARRADSIRVGSALDNDTEMGPQASEQQLTKTLSYVDLGKDEGATLLAGGQRLTGRLAGGFYVAPTVFSDVDNRMRIAQDEIFGPVCSIIPFEDEAEAIKIANDSMYGLTAGVWTQNLGRAHRVAAELEAGTVWVNTYRQLRWNIPYGGFKLSGIGRENGPEGLDEYLETRATIMDLVGQYPDMYPESSER